VIYKIRISGWGDSVAIGDTVEDLNDKEIKVLSIVKVESDEGEIYVFVLGVEPSKIEL
jgi:hypothetical protein